MVAHIVIIYKLVKKCFRFCTSISSIMMGGKPITIQEIKVQNLKPFFYHLVYDENMYYHARCFNIYIYIYIYIYTRLHIRF